MRRPWIKIETCTPDKPEICSIATQLKLDEDTVVGKLVRLWAWAELNRIQPNDIGVTKEFVDKLVGRKGFAAALAQTGWLVETEGKLSFRNFKRHNSPVAQNKALTAKRVARHRLRKAATQDDDTVESLADRITDIAPKVVKKPKKQRVESGKNATAKPLPEPMLEVPIADDNPNSLNNVSDVNIPDVVLEINEEDDFEHTLESTVTVTPTIESVPAAIEVETLPPITPKEALAVLQVEEPAPRKKRSKSAADADDQPMLF